MSNYAAISASLVDVRNIAAHKCVRLEIHVPAEQAGQVLEAFGWPTAVDPVPVAIARLNHAPSSHAPDEQPPAAPDALQQPENAHYTEEPRRPWNELRPSARAAILCGETAFLVFLKVKTKEEAIEKLRRHCDVKSRSELDSDDTKRMKFEMVERDFARWREEKHF